MSYLLQIFSICFTIFNTVTFVYLAMTKEEENYILLFKDEISEEGLKVRHLLIIVFLLISIPSIIAFKVLISIALVICKCGNFNITKPKDKV